MCLHQPYLRLLRRVQETLQHQAMEDVHRLLQLLAYCCHYRREDLHHARWSQPRLELDGTDQACHATNRRELHQAKYKPPLAIVSMLTIAPPLVYRFPIAACSVTCSGPIQTRTLPGGARTTVVSLSPLVRMLFHASCKSTTWISSAVLIKSSRTDTSFSPNANSSLYSVPPTTVENLTMPVL